MPWKRRPAMASDNADEPETKWVCSSRCTPHHNIRKQTCRSCEEERPPKQQTNEKATASAQPEGPTKAGKGPGRGKSVQVPRQPATCLSQSGVTLDTVTLPAPESGCAGDGPKKLEDMSTERLQDAMEARQGFGFPESAIRPYTDILDQWRQAEAQAQDP